MSARGGNDEGQASRSEKPSHIASRVPRRAAQPRTDEEVEGEASAIDTAPERED